MRLLNNKNYKTVVVTRKICEKKVKRFSMNGLPGDGSNESVSMI
jgi:hypothetical protein